MNTSLIKLPDVVIPEILPDAADYVRRFEEAYCRTVEGIIRAGTILSEAHARLNYGEWEAMFRDHLISVSKRTANRLISIAYNQVLQDGANWSHLPYTWTTLYALSRIPLNTLQKGIDAGLIFPEMRAKDLKAIMGQKASGPAPFDESQSAKRIKKFLEKEARGWASRTTFWEAVVRIVDSMGGKA